ncbi:uncharacterized protein LOC108247257 [Kryptolebias marmoratus]|uniref:uncharacterized protein LOC108247257 n=1 Tax=Kryptolebias marmoratus TaxID=37003 RepID=UPI0007F936E7|nr:uncharacterized protein LOC108247257 [Kryptolebias marmoratus]
MLLGLCLRVAWICLLFSIGNCFPVDYRDHNTTSLVSSESLDFSDAEYPEVSPPGNESSLEAASAAAEPPSTPEPKDSNITSESNSTSSPAVPSPRAFPSAPSKGTEEKMPDFLMHSQPVSSAGGFGATPPSPWYRPPFFHEDVYAGAGAHPYGYERGIMEFPHYSYAGSPPYGYNYGTALSPPDNYAYGSGGSSPHGSVAPGYHPVGHGTTRTTSSYSYLPQQPAIIDPELLLIGNILMRIRQMPLAQAWGTSEVPVGMLEKYPLSHVVQSHGGYHRARDLYSNNQYSENPSDLRPAPEIQQRQQNVPVTGF